MIKQKNCLSKPDTQRTLDMVAPCTTGTQGVLSRPVLYTELADGATQQNLVSDGLTTETATSMHLPIQEWNGLPRMYGH